MKPVLTKPIQIEPIQIKPKKIKHILSLSIPTKPIQTDS